MGQGGGPTRAHKKSSFVRCRTETPFASDFDAPRGVVAAFTAQYEVWADDAWRPAVRYDSAHGRPHRDTLDWSGNVVTKDWLPEGTDANAALAIAVDDLKANADRYRDEFLRRRP